MQGTTTGQMELSALQATVNKMLNKVPYSIRESVLAVVNLISRKCEDQQVQLDIVLAENQRLKQELKAANSKTIKSEQNEEVYKQKISQLQDQVVSMQDDVDSRQRYSIRNKRFIAQLSKTNQLLIDSIHAVQGDVKLDDDPAPFVQGTTMKAEMEPNDMKAILLRMMRDNYQAKENLHIMEHRVDELRAHLKRSEKQCRQYEQQLEELKSTGAVSVVAVQKVDEKPTKKGSTASIDERLEQILTRNASDQIEVITKIQGIMAHLAGCPRSLDLSAVSSFLCRPEAARALGVDVLVIFVYIPFIDLLYKYTPRSTEPEIIYNTNTKSILTLVSSTGQTMRYNTLDSTFDSQVDGCPGLKVTRALSVPMIGRFNGKPVGGVHFLNKSNGELLSDVDEVLAFIYATEVACLVSACLAHDRLAKQFKVMCSLPDIAETFYSALPDATSSVPIMLHPLHVLLAMEAAVKRVTRCAKCRAFLSTKTALDSDTGEMLTFVKKLPEITSSAQEHELDAAELTFGVAGRVALTKASLVLTGEDDSVFSPLVDIDAAESVLLTTAIVDYKGNVLGCVQIVVSQSYFATFEGTSEEEDGITMTTALELVASELLAPLLYSLQFLHKQFLPPM